LIFPSSSKGRSEQADQFKPFAPLVNSYFPRACRFRSFRLDRSKITCVFVSVSYILTEPPGKRSKSGKHQTYVFGPVVCRGSLGVSKLEAI
jgi:hypothetical protein